MSPKRTSIQPGQKLELALTPAERKAIVDHLTLLPPEYEVMLRNVHPEQPLLLTLDDLEDFSGYVAAEANHTKNMKLGAVLDSAYEKMAVLLDTFTDQEASAKKRTKRVLGAEREDVEMRPRISEQAALLATLVAGILHAADKAGAKDRVLNRFIPGEPERLVLTTLKDISPAVCKRLESGENGFTLAEVGGMLMAIASELCVAAAPQRIAMLMVANTLMAAINEGVPQGKERGSENSPRARASGASQAKKPRDSRHNKRKPGP